MKEFPLLPQHFDPRILYIMRRNFVGPNVMESHAHDHVSIIYILDGASHYEIGGRIHRVEAGTLFICNPGVTHHRIVGDRERMTEFQTAFTNIGLKGLPAGFLIAPDDDPMVPLLHHRTAPERGHRHEVGLHAGKVRKGQHCGCDRILPQ